MADLEHKNRPLVGGLTFLGSTVFQLALGLLTAAITSSSGDRSLSGWVVRNQWWSLAILLTVSTLLTSLTMWYLAHRDLPQPNEGDLATSIAAELSLSMRTQIDKDARLKVVESSLAIPVRWRAADPSLMDQWSNIRGEQSSQEPIPLGGSLDDILPLWETIPSHRLVVLGKAGAGKSILLMRFMRAKLLARSAAGNGPVPVLFGLATWNPTTTTLVNWLERELRTQQPSLGRKLRDGKTLAQVLIDGEHLLYILDGLDEMSSGLRAKALAALSASLPGTCGAIVSCRTAEYRAAAIESGPLAGAAAIVIDDLTPRDVRAYLPRTLGDAGRGSPWSDVLATAESALPGGPGAAVRQVLRTPLMVHLARVVYQKPASQPAELLQCTAAEQVEQLLLDRYLAAALDSQAGRRDRLFRKSERYLQFIARHLADAGTPYFRWWQLPRSLTRQGRITIGFVVGLALTIFYTVLYGPWTTFEDYEQSDTSELWAGILYPVAASLLPGLTLGYLVTRFLSHDAVLGLGTLPTPVRIRRHWNTVKDKRFRTRNNRQTWRIALRIGLVASVLGSLPIELIFYLMVPDDEGPPTFLLPFLPLFSFANNFLIFTPAVWVALQVGQLVEEPVRLAEALSPAALIRSDRNTALLESILGGVTATIIAQLPSLTAWPLYVWFGEPDSTTSDSGPTSVSSVLSQFVLASTVSTFLLPALIMLFALSAWGRYTLSRLYLSFSGALPFRLVKFLTVIQQKGVLRQTGPTFQFRHLKLRDRLADRGTALPEGPPEPIGNSNVGSHSRAVDHLPSSTEKSKH